MARVDSDVNMDRFYSVQLTQSLFGDVGVERQWGRRRTRGRRRLDWYGNEQDAKSALSDLVKAKLSRGYFLKQLRPPTKAEPAENTWSAEL
nr:WGR domain-containing protein [uncultured Roseobacter sp.]